MKKIYNTPSVNVIELKQTVSLCAGSNNSVKWGGEEGNTHFNDQEMAGTSGSGLSQGAKKGDFSFFDDL